MTHRGPFQPLLFCDSVIPLVQDLAFLFPEVCEIPVGPFLPPVGVPLSGHSPVWSMSLSFQFCTRDGSFDSGGFSTYSSGIGPVHVVDCALKMQYFS